MFGIEYTKFVRIHLDERSMRFDVLRFDYGQSHAVQGEMLGNYQLPEGVVSRTELGLNIVVQQRTVQVHRDRQPRL